MHSRILSEKRTRWQISEGNFPSEIKTRMRKSVGGTTFLKRQSNFARVETICVVMSLAVESSVDPEIEECEVTISGQERKLDTSKDGK